MSERHIVCADLNRAIDDLRLEGFRLDSIYPADDPSTALLSRAGETVRLTLPGASPLPEGPPPFAPEFVLTRAGATGGQGRAGMLYRDLIPSRLGGRYIASHIMIPQAGPVSDWVHYHRILVQMIFVRRGWVRVVYEGEGEPFVMHAGDLVIQPPLIRHRVLESSTGLEVIEITAPALHETFADHELDLPNGELPDRLFEGQRFLRHVAADTPWTPFGGGEAQETGLRAATAGLMDARVIRADEGASIAFPPHEGELVFGFVLGGTARLDAGAGHALASDDAFVIPPGEAWSVSGAGGGFEFLHATTARLDDGACCPL